MIDVFARYFVAYPEHADLRRQAVALFGPPARIDCRVMTGCACCAMPVLMDIVDLLDVEYRKRQPICPWCAQARVCKLARQLTARMMEDQP